MSGRQQYRVTWRRRDWSDTSWSKFKTFSSEAAAIEFARKLHGEWDGASSEVTALAIHVRDVSPWRPYEVAR